MSQTFHFPLTASQYAARRQQLASQGITLPAGDSGTMTYSGVEVAFNYDDSVLTLDIVHKPRFLPSSFVESKIREWFQA